MKDWSKRNVRKLWKRLRPEPQMTGIQKGARSLAIVFIGGFLSLMFITIFYAVFLLFVLPNPSELAKLNLTESTLIMDREGNLLYAIHGEENRDSLDSLDEISPWIVDATISIEDDEFYRHIGIDIPALFKAVLSEFGIGPPRGGSTITQQFVKNTFLSPERTYKRKFQEVVLSLMVELKFSKDEILLMYLNAIPYGSNAYGIQLAADRYFGKDAADLTLAESAILASIPKAPTRYSPYGNYRRTTIHFELSEENLDGRVLSGESDLKDDEWTRGLVGETFELPDGETFYVKGRSDLVLDRMLSLNVITEKEAEDAVLAIQEIEFTPYRDTIKAPHFVLMVKQILEEKYGSAVVEQGGLRVYTTLDPDFQAEAERAVEEKKESNEDKYGAGNAAMVSIQPQTGQILSMVGSADYFDDEIDGQVNMITSNRQPGSSFKPFVYSLAFLNQWNPATVLYDVPTRIGTDKPNNYDGAFWGPMSMRYALAQSRNIPAAKTYFMAGQEEAIIPYVKSFGMDSVKDEGNYGWPLALGAVEITPLELAEAYTVFANSGVHVDISPILKIENADGEIFEQWEEKDLEKTEVLDPQVAFLINDILSDAPSGLGPSTRVESIDNAAKTGTSNKKLPNGNILPSNTWLVGYTPSLVTVTWAGNADGSAMKANASGYATAAPIWKSFTTSILDRVESTVWPRPEGIRDIAISKASGKLPSKETPSDEIRTEVFASFAVPTEIDNSFQTLKIESISGRLATEWSPQNVVEEKTFRIHQSPLAAQWPHWQQAVLDWAAGQEDAEQPPTEFASDIHNSLTATRAPQITITSPLSLTAISPDARTVEIEVDLANAENGLDEIVFYMNDTVQYRSNEAPYTGVIRPPINATDGTILDIKVEVVDIHGYSGLSTIQLRVGQPEPEEEAPSPAEEDIEELEE